MSKLLVPYQVAEKLGVNVQTVKIWRIIGKIKTVKLPSGMYRIPEEEINRILGKETNLETQIEYKKICVR